MINYDKTIKEFFYSVDEFLTRRLQCCKDAAEKIRIQKNQENIRAVSAGLLDTALYGDQLRKHIVPNFFGFIFQNSHDSDAYISFIKVMSGIENYYFKKSNKNNPLLLEKAERELLESLKNWYIVKNNNIFKCVVLRLKKAQSFAVHVKQK